MKNLHEKITYKNSLGDVISLTYSFPYFLQEVTGVDGVEVDIYKTKSGGSDGYTINNKSLRDRPLQILGVIKAKSKDEAARYRARLLKVFNPQAEGEVTYEYGEKTRKIKCVVERAPQFSKKEGSFKHQLFSISLLCPDPFFKDLFEKSEEIAVWRGSFSFPLELVEEGVEVGFREPSLIVNVYNSGDISCGMRVQFKALATVTNPSLFNVNTREEIKLNKTMEAGDVITVTTHFQNKRVTLTRAGVNTNAFNYLDLDSEFLQLAKGDNLFRYDADENLENLEVSIYYTPHYLGV